MKVSIIGCGYASYYCVSMKNYKNIQLVGVYDHNEDKRDKLAKYNKCKSYNTFDELLNDKSNKGRYEKSMIKNIWSDTLNSYYEINSRLRMGCDNIIFIKRNEYYLWEYIYNLRPGDSLFKNKNNVFEKIETIQEIHEESIVYNIQLDRIYTYFANNYLNHNASPCDGCAGCGSGGGGKGGK